MAQMSYFWTTNGAGTGDQVASYTQAQLAIAHAIIAACSGFEGVAPGYDDELACSDGGANTVDVATGGAMVDGIPYSNGAVENVNIPSAVGGGNTRIDRLVLRATWASFAVRITRIAGTDAASPVAPAITQTSGTTYDIQLCQVLVDVSGNVTVTDERTWAAVDTNGIAAGAVTAAKIALNAVDDTKLGDRVPQFYRRQGGDATAWGVTGTTSYTPGSVRMQAGSASVPASGTLNVTFPVAFSGAPLVFTNIEAIPGNAKIVYMGSGASTTAFNLQVTDMEGNPVGSTVYWLAIGSE